MCGISGVYLYNRAHESSLGDWATRQLRAIDHRGRDEFNVFCEDNVGIGITRLSIIDLETGSQPFFEANGRYVLFYNGEIYNFNDLRRILINKGHEFKSNGDSEVVLKCYLQYGVDCLKMFNGMFAFAVFDRKEKKIFLARDRFGIKPLYYCMQDDIFAFASEVKGILAIPIIRKSIDSLGLSIYLSHNYLPPPYTLIDGVRQLEPGHYITVGPDGRIGKEQWYTVQDIEGPNLSQSEIDEGFDHLFTRAVERQLISDVPLGAFLSGGLDSSAIVQVLAEIKGSGINTFSVGFEEDSYNEAMYAKTIAERSSTTHHVVIMDHRQYWNYFLKSISQQDNPVADQATVPLLMLSELARRHVKVALSGDGGDEVLGGYITVFADRYQPYMNLLPSAFIKAVSTAISAFSASTSKVSLDFKIKSFLRGAGLSREDAHASWRMINDYHELRQLVSSDFDIRDSWPFLPYRAAFDAAGKGSFYSRASRADLKVWLVGNNLTKVDSMTMGVNLEARVPFLDNELVDFLLMLPEGLKSPGRQLKVILKRNLSKRGVPDIIVNRSKAGFHSPIPHWFKGVLRAELEDLFRGNTSIYHDGIIKKDKVFSLLNEHITGRANNAFKLYGLSILVLWYEKFFKGN